ncbi:MAG: tetratricopeptide repeat protein [Thermoanaerobaculia bacterium]
MSESVVVIHSQGEEAAARGLCAAIEARGAECWTPLRSSREATDAAVDGHIRNAVALVVVTRDALRHRREIEFAKSHAVGVVIASSEDSADAWSATLAELQLAGAIDTAASGAKAAVFSQPRVYIGADEEPHIEYIAENVSEAQVFVRFGLFDKAIGRLRAVLERSPRNLEAQNEMLKIYLEENEHDNAASVAADYLDSLLFRGEEEAYAMLRSHLLAHGFAVDDGPPVAVGAAGGVFRTTRFAEAPATVAAVAPAAPPPVRHVAEVPPAPPRSLALAPEPLAFDLPILRNFRSSQPVLETTGIEADLGGIDFLFEHGLLDEARMRIDQMMHEHPEHPGVVERKQRIDAIGGPRPGSALLSLALDEEWGVPTAPAAHKEPPRSQPAPPSPALSMPAPPVAVPAAGDEPSGPAVDLVCSVFCPLAVDEGDSFVVRLWIHSTEETEADGVALVEDRREAAMMTTPVRRGDTLDIALTLPDLEIDGSSVVEVVWNGVVRSVAFNVTAPAGTAENQVEGWLVVERDGEKIGEVPLRIRVA